MLPVGLWQLLGALWHPKISKSAGLAGVVKGRLAMVANVLLLLLLVGWLVGRLVGWLLLLLVLLALFVLVCTSGAGGCGGSSHTSPAQDRPAGLPESDKYSYDDGYEDTWAGIVQKASDCRGACDRSDKSGISRDPRGSCGEVCIVQPNPHVFMNKKNGAQSHEALKVQGNKIEVDNSEYFCIIDWQWTSMNSTPLSNRCNRVLDPAVHVPQIPPRCQTWIAAGYHELEMAGTLPG